jgi:hypothetical protein
MWPTFREIQVLKKCQQTLFWAKMRKSGQKTVLIDLKCTFFKIWEMA